MRKQFLAGGLALSAFLIALFSFGQSPSPTETPTASPTPTLVSTSTPTPSPTPTASPTPTLTPTISPNESGTVSGPMAPAGSNEVGSTGTGSTRTRTRSTTVTEIRGTRPARKFTLKQAILTGIKQNPDLLRAKEEIQRTKGVVLEISALALPHVIPTSNLSWTDPNLGRISGSSSTTTSGGGGASISGGAAWAYNIRNTGSPLVANYSTFRQIRGTFFQRDSAYFAFRSCFDQVISTIKTQLYQVILNRALITVQEEAVHLLESQLKDQQNRFEAGTVPRFNVLQAEVALSNQIPNLISARNAYRISQLTLAKTLGLDFDPLRGEGAPLEVIGELTYIPRKANLVEAIEIGKQNRPFLKQARANVYNQIEQVHVALGGFLPNVTSTGGYDVFSSPWSSDWHDSSQGWVFGLQGTWAVWDSGETYGRYKQQRALLSETKITYDDDVRQVELEIQQAFSNLIQNRELIQSTEKTVEQAQEAVRLAQARLGAGAGTQLDVLNAQVQLTTAQSTRLQALFGYNSTVAEFDRVTGAASVYSESFDGIAPHSTKSSIYDTSSGKTATGKRKTSESH